MLGILAPTLQRELQWSEADYGDIVSWFSFAYAFGFLIAGRVIDWIGVRRGLAAAVVAWSVAAMAHALAKTAAGFSIARAMLGVGESAIFPGSIKAIAEWFPQKERALATGIFNAGTNTGAILTPLLVPWITLTWGWQSAFVVTGALGFVWLLLWIPLYRNPAIPRAIRRRPNRGAMGQPVPASTDVGVHRRQVHGRSDLVVLLLLAAEISRCEVRREARAGRAADHRRVSHCGRRFRRWRVDLQRTDQARLDGESRTQDDDAGDGAAHRADGLRVTGAEHVGAVLIVGVAAAAHQAWSANVYTLASDMFPKFAVGSVVGIGGFAGAMGGVCFNALPGAFSRRTAATTRRSSSCAALRT